MHSKHLDWLVPGRRALTYACMLTRPNTDPTGKCNKKKMSYDQVKQR